ncbi:MAG TPA: right-handed parallel beta-helix repeat-containing protein [Planctomycetota bacterium]|nr:right-handed parallel beta-helix repeat-containing protein [Planctomycetota bacterium]
MTSPSLRAFVACAALCLLAGASTAQTLIIYVDRDATGANTGATWADAFTDLQAGIAAGQAHSLATGAYSQVWVAEGSYAPAGPGGARTATFALTPQVGLYGGFAGHETRFTDRDPAAHPTILTGDLQGDDQPDWVNHWNNAYHVVTADGQETSAVLDGFVVRGGYAEDQLGGHSSGGGLRSLTGSPTIVACTFTDNFASSGAAVVLGAYWSPNLRASIRDCTFQGNLAQPYRAGALYVLGNANLELDGCAFLGNRTTGFSSPADGGAIFIEAGARVSIRRSRFVGNVSSASSPSMFEGGAICNLSDLLVLDSCVFAGNSAETGGGLWNGGDITVSQCVFSGNTAVVGGGMINFFNTATVQGCTFSANTAGDGGGLANSYSPLVDVRNCVLWANVSPGQPTMKAQVHNLNNATCEIRWSLVQGLFDIIPGEDPPDPADYPGCLAANPLFADANGADNLTGTADDDLALLSGSPARDAGRNDFVPAGLLADAAGATRFHDDPAAPDAGNGTPPLVDMGALEGGAPVVWTALGGGTPNGQGRSVLRGAGPLLAGTSGSLKLTHYMPGAAAPLFLSLGAGAAPFKGGTLVAFPPILVVWFWIDVEYEFTLAWPAWPAGASGLTLVFQFALGEPSGLFDTSLSNGLTASVP